jgi:hypothetical protein
MYRLANVEICMVSLGCGKKTESKRVTPPFDVGGDQQVSDLAFLAGALRGRGLGRRRSAGCVSLAYFRSLRMR